MEDINSVDKTSLFTLMQIKRFTILTLRSGLEACKSYSFQKEFRRCGTRVDLIRNIIFSGGFNMSQTFSTICFAIQVFFPILVAAVDHSLIPSDIAQPVHFLCNTSTGDTALQQQHTSLGEGTTSPAPGRGPKDSLQPRTHRAAPTL